MSNIFNFNDYRLTHARTPKPRYFSDLQRTINLLHQLRLQYDRTALELELDRYQARRTYYQIVSPSVYADQTPAAINRLVRGIRKKAEPAIVLDFSYGKQALMQRKNASAENPIV